MAGLAVQSAWLQPRYMIYLDITMEQEAKAMATLESENDKKVSVKWKKAGNSISSMCGLKKLAGK